MKISTSPSSFDFNSNEATAGCLSGLLRLILCKNFHHSALTGSSTNELATADHHHHHHQLKEEEAPRKPPPSPNLVARLMGLDSMPVHPYTPESSFVRSRSANSIEGWNGFLSGQASWASRNRISQSFREEPTFLRKESDEFLVLSFGPRAKQEEAAKPNPDLDVEKRINTKRAERRTAQGKENACKPLRRRRHQKELHRKCRQDANNTSSNSQPKKQRSSSVSAPKKTESECSSQDSSPVSVLDQRFHVDPDSPISEEGKRPKGERPRKKLSAGLETDSYPSTAKTNEIKDRGHRGGKRHERKEQCYSDTWGQICQLAAEDVKNSWRVDDNIEEIAADLGLEILDLIVDEVLAELSACRGITD